MKFLTLKITGILLGGFLFLGAGSGQALVSPEHYKRIKMQNQQKTKEAEKVPVKIQVHQSSQGQAPAGKAGQK
jgi:hypothetical protein